MTVSEILRLCYETYVVIQDEIQEDDFVTRWEGYIDHFDADRYAPLLDKSVNFITPAYSIHPTLYVVLSDYGSAEM